MEISSLKTKNNCTYTVTRKITSRCFEATMEIAGGLGRFESDSKVLLVTTEPDEARPTFNSLADPIESVDTDYVSVDVYAFDQRIVDEMTHKNTSDESERTSAYDAVMKTFMEKGKKQDCYDKSGCVYEGPRKNGQYHGFGRLTYSDGRVYEGMFSNGLRHGQGTLTMPSGEYFVGAFDNDRITENGTYYDADGNPRDLDAENYLSPAQRFWLRTRDLWLSILFFALIFFVILIADWGVERGVIHGGAVILPVVFFYNAIKHLIRFFKSFRTT